MPGWGVGGGVRRVPREVETWRRQGQGIWAGWGWENELQGPRGPTLGLTGTRSHRFGKLAGQWGDAGIRERWEGLVAAWDGEAE